MKKQGQINVNNVLFFNLIWFQCIFNVKNTSDLDFFFFAFFHTKSSESDMDVTLFTAHLS